MKLLLLGFDGLEFDYVTKFLPSFVDQAYGRLVPEEKYLFTGPSWSSIYTGLKAGKHKVTDQLGQEWGEHLCLKNSPATTFWEYIIDKSDLKVGLVGMPCTFPLKSLKRDDCFVVAGFPLFDEKVSTFPFSLGSVLKKYDYVVDVVDFLCGIKDYSFWMRSGEQAGWLYMVQQIMVNEPNFLAEACLEVAKRRMKVAKAAVEIFDTEILCIQFSFIDHLGHLIPKEGDDFVGFRSKAYGEYVNIFYRIVGQIWEMVMEWFCPEKMVVCSDHGFAIQHTMDGFYAVQQYGDYPITKVVRDYPNTAICPTILSMLNVDVDYNLFDSDPISLSIDENMIRGKLQGLGYL